MLQFFIHIVMYLGYKLSDGTETTTPFKPTGYAIYSSGCLLTIILSLSIFNLLRFGRVLTFLNY